MTAEEAKGASPADTAAVEEQEPLAAATETAAEDALNALAKPASEKPGDTEPAQETGGAGGSGEEPPEPSEETTGGRITDEALAEVLLAFGWQVPEDAAKPGMKPPAGATLSAPALEELAAEVTAAMEGFDGEDVNRAVYASIRPEGSFEKWKSFTLETRKNLLIRLMMDASFASALISKVSALPFVFHLWGKTGTGKTVALKIAMSIWGDPRMGKLTRTMNMTQNSMMSTAAFLNSIPFAGDELQTIKSRWDNYDQLIMRITEGIDRGRMNELGNQRETKTWSCSFIFTGEEPCTRLNSGGGIR